MEKQFETLNHGDLIALALAEDSAAVQASTEEARLAHYALAGQLRQRADELAEMAGA